MAESDWDTFFLGEAAYKAGKSKDRSTRHGAVIVTRDHTELSSGWNGFPRGVDDDIAERHARPAKYWWTEHAERNAIYNAARAGIPLLGSTIYVTGIPCCDCARAIIQAGIAEVVATPQDWSDPHLLNTFHVDVTRTLFEEAGVRLRFHEQEAVQPLLL